MASTDDKRPVSAGNVKEYLSRSVVFQVYDVLYDRSSDGSKSSISFPFGDYDYVVIDSYIKITSGDRADVMQNVVPVHQYNDGLLQKNTTLTLVTANNAQLTVKTNNGTMTISSPTYVSRVTGIRIGGGVSS